jgi:hypothetical protein
LISTNAVFLAALPPTPSRWKSRTGDRVLSFYRSPRTQFAKPAHDRLLTISCISEGLSPVGLTVELADFGAPAVSRDSENAPLRATQAGSLLCVHHRRIDRSRLPVDSAYPCRANRSASDHAAFSGGPFDISGPRVKEVGGTSSVPPTPAPLAESRSVQEWLRRGCELPGRSFHRRMRVCNPNA